ncbi:thiamine phosphate synthase [Longibacter salinarum]|uniref:Thiamine phosphate synthase n=1 Tax=Longibacter salinarum TaxID=1850348 RepID=A0A2A8D1K9_9BACT|nr:thiamine phosphate synthase [Longibacter salinarum]PEN14796.1 thiamine phosphate synthase [Longibacter salinarum]
MDNLPRLILVADRFTESDRQVRVFDAVRAGVPWIHLRDHEADDATFRRAAVSLTEQIEAEGGGTRISVNQRLDVADDLGLDYHAGSHGAGVQEARDRLGASAIIGYSAHEDQEVTGARSEIVDYLFYSPIFPTSSKPDHPGMGLAELSRVCAVSTRPVFALGGITPERVTPCLRKGAHGVAVLSGLMEAKDVRVAAEEYLQRLASIRQYEE